MVKKSQNLSIIIDVVSNSTALLEGQSGILFLIDFNSKVVFRLGYNANTSSAVWLASTKTFETYFYSLPSLKALSQIAVQFGSKSSLSSLSQDDDQDIHKFFLAWGITDSNKEALELLASFAAQLRGKVGTLYLTNGSFNSPNSLEWYIKLNLAFGILLDSSGNLQLQQSLRFNLGFVFSASSGLEALIRILGQVGQRVDLTRAFPNLFSNQYRVVKLLEDVSGGSHNGLDGLITIVVNIIKFLEGRGTLITIFNSITYYNLSSDGDTNLTTVFNDALQLVESQNRLFNNSAQFHVFITILQRLNSGSFIWNNVNLSDIIKLLNATNPYGQFNATIEIIRKIAPAGVNQFFSYVLGLLNSTQGIGALQRLFPGLNLANFTGSGNILGNILQRYNVSQLFTGSSNITAALSGIPVIGPIISSTATSFGKEFQQFFNVSIIRDDIQRIVNASVLNGPFGGIIGGLTNLTGSGNILGGIGVIVENIGDAVGSILGIGELKAYYSDEKIFEIG